MSLALRTVWLGLEAQFLGLDLGLADQVLGLGLEAKVLGLASTLRSVL